MTLETDLSTKPDPGELAALFDFFDNAPVGLHIVDPEGIIRRANRKELETMGYAGRPQAYVGHHIAEFHADQAVIDDMLARLVSGRPLESYRARLLHESGEILPAVIHSSPRMRGGDFLNTRCFTYVDPGFRPAAAPTMEAPPFDLEALSGAERDRLFEDLDDFFENAPVSLHIVGPDGMIRRANRKELETMGYAYAPEDYVGHHIAEFHADPAVIDDMLGRLVGGRPLVHHHATLVRGDGSEYPVFIYSSPRMRGGEFVNTRCFTFPRSLEEGERLVLSWPRDDEAERAGQEESSPLTAALQRVAGRKRVEESLALLAETGKLFAATPDHRASIARLASLLVPHLADWCAIDLLAADASRERLGFACRPQLEALDARLEEPLYRAGGDASLNVHRVGASGQAAVCFDSAAEGEETRSLRELGVQSMFVVPFHSHAGRDGALTLVRTRSEERGPFGRGDLALSEELARRVAAAVDVGTLYGGSS